MAACSIASNLALVFDLDGVIVDSNPVHAEAWAAYLRRFGVEPDETVPERMYGRRNDEIVTDFFGERLSPQAIAAHGAAKETLYRHMMQTQLRDRLVPGVVSFLKHYGGAPTGLATNAEPENAEFVLQGAGLREYFDVVVDGQQVERPKPSPEIYLRAAELLHTAPANCIVFEDSFSGVNAARAAGTRVVALRTTHSSFAVADLEIDDFLSPELQLWLQRQLPQE